MALDGLGEIFDRPLPAAVDAEKVLLGAILLENHLISHCAALSVPDFVSPFHRQVFSAMLELGKDRTPLDPVLIGELLNNRQEEFFGNVAEVTNLTSGVPTGLHILDYVRLIREKTARRDAIRRLNYLQSKLWDETLPVKDLCRSLSALENHLRQDHAEETDSFKSLGEVFQTDVLPTLEAYNKGDPSQFLISTGFPEIDRVLGGGVYLSDFIAVVAPPKSAKSAFALQLALNFADAGETVAVLSLEMSNLQNGLRFIAQQSYKNSIEKHGYPVEAISASWLRPGIFEETYRQAKAVAASMFETKLLLCQKPLDWMELQAETRRLVKEKNLRVLIVDYWQLVSNRRRGQSRADSLADIAKGLKQLGQELNIVVIALGQFNQEGLKLHAGGKELDAQLYLEGSGELAKSANIVITLDIEPGNMNDRGAPRAGRMIFKPLRSAGDAALKCFFYGKYLTVEID